MAETHDPKLPAAPARSIEVASRVRSPMHLQAGPIRGVPALPEALTAPPTPMGLLKALRKRWPVVLGLTLLIAPAAAAAAWLLMPTKDFEAYSTLHVSSLPPRMVFETVDQESTEQWELFQSTQRTLIQDAFVIQAALRDPKIAKSPEILKQPDPVVWLQQHLRVGFSGEIMRITVTGQNRELIKDLANAVTDAYLEQVVNRDRVGRTEKHARLREFHGKLVDAIKSKKESLRNLAELAGTTNTETMATRHRFVMEQLQDATRELIRIQNEQRKLGVDLQVAIDKASAGGPPEVLHQELNTALRQDAKYNTLLADLIRHQKALDASRQKARNPRDAAVKNIHNETLQIQAELADHVDVVREAILAKKERSGSNSQITQIEEQLIKLGELERIVNGEVKVLEASTKKAGRESFELEALRDELKQDDETLAKVNQEISMLGFELQAEERVKLWNRAYSPYTLNMKKQILATAAAGLGSAGFIMFAVALWEVRRKRVDTAEQIVQGLGLDLVGVLPALPSRSRKALASEGSRDQHWDHILLESVDATCAMLLHASRAEGLQTIMVVSAVTGEGKTSLACHLATSLARARRRTLLIDCDLRNPAAHLMYGLPLEGGVCEILRGEIEVADSIQPTMANGLSMITAGHCDPIAIQALSHGGIEPIFEKLKAEFDYIVIDSAPILPVADSLHISQHVDAALFSVLRDVSRLPKIYAAYERLAKLGVRILGAVVSGTPCEDYRSVYSYSAASRGAGRLSTVGE